MKTIIKTKLAIIAAFIVMSVVSVYAGYTYSTFHVTKVTEAALQDHDIDSAKKLMIVAHPDDDVLWGGGHLMDKDYFIVVVTNGNNAVRKQEFYKFLKESGNRGIILSYPDKTYGKKDSWKKNKKDIQKDLQKIICYKHWDLIVTHNPEGEYGHIHHKMTNQFVTAIYKDKLEGSDCMLYYFGKYYTKNKIKDVKSSLGTISEEQLKYKEELEKVYKSQANTIKMFEHMNSHEDWVPYNEFPES